MANEYQNEFDRVSLGCLYSDRLTGFAGVATAKTLYFDAEPMVMLEPEMKNDSLPEPRWVLAKRLDQKG